MQMSNAEIARSFRAAANRKQQVPILAQLNGVSENDIRNILISEGIPESEFGTGKRGRKSRYQQEAELKEIATIEQLRGMRPEDMTEEQKDRLDRAMNIPMAVRIACTERADTLQEKILAFEAERDTILDFLQGFKQEVNTNG